MSRYVIEASWSGLDWKLQEKMRKVAKRPSDGSGYWVEKKRYDISWSFTQEPAARRLAARLRKAAPKRVRIVLRDLEKEK